MEFNAPATENLFDRAKLVGKSTPRIDGPLKVSGAATIAMTPGARRASPSSIDRIRPLAIAAPTIQP